MKIFPRSSVVDSFTRHPPDGGSTRSELLPSVNPTFKWIRLVEHVPARVYVAEVPEEVDLRIGFMASVLMMTRTAETVNQRPVSIAPRVASAKLKDCCGSECVS